MLRQRKPSFCRMALNIGVEPTLFVVHHLWVMSETEVLAKTFAATFQNCDNFPTTFAQTVLVQLVSSTNLLSEVLFGKVKAAIAETKRGQPSAFKGVKSLSRLSQNKIPSLACFIG